MSFKEEKKDKKGKDHWPKPDISILSEEKLFKEEKKKTDSVKLLEAEQRVQKEKALEVRAQAKFLKISPKKVRLVIDVIRGMRVKEALEKLPFIKKKAVFLVIKLLNSALANAENNYKLNKEDLYIKKIFANEGPTLHRWQPRAYGRAAPIQKRTTHLLVLLGLKEEMVKNKAQPSPLVKRLAKTKEKLAKKDRKEKSKLVKRSIKEKEIISKKKPEKKRRREKEFPMKKEESIL